MRLLRFCLFLTLLAIATCSCSTEPQQKVAIDVGAGKWRFEIPQSWLLQNDELVKVWNDQGQRKLALQLHGKPPQTKLQELVVSAMRTLRADNPANWANIQEQAEEIQKVAPASIADRTEAVQILLAEPWSENEEKREKLYRALRDHRTENLHSSKPFPETRAEELLVRYRSSPTPPKLEEVVVGGVPGFQYHEKDSEGDSWSLFLPFGENMLECQLWGTTEEFQALKDSMNIPTQEKQDGS